MVAAYVDGRAEGSGGRGASVAPGGGSSTRVRHGRGEMIREGPNTADGLRCFGGRDVQHSRGGLSGVSLFSACEKMVQRSLLSDDDGLIRPFMS